MSYKIVANEVGQINVNPRIVRVESSDILATVTAAGYLDGAKMIGAGLMPTDVILMSYAGGTNFFAPAFNNGIITLSAISGDSNNVILPVVSGNLPQFSGTTGQMEDSGVEGDTVLFGNVLNPDTSSNIFVLNIIATAADFNFGGGTGRVLIYPGNADHNYQILDIFLNKDGTNFSGAAGDRDVSVTDSLTTYTAIPAATLQSLNNYRWGNTQLPAPSAPLGASWNTPVLEGFDLFLQYSSGTTNYATGLMNLVIVMQRFAT